MLLQALVWTFHLEVLGEQLPGHRTSSLIARPHGYLKIIWGRESTARVLKVKMRGCKGLKPSWRRIGRWFGVSRGRVHEPWRVLSEYLGIGRGYTEVPWRVVGGPCNDAVARVVAAYYVATTQMAGGGHLTCTMGVPAFNSGDESFPDTRHKAPMGSPALFLEHRSPCKAPRVAWNSI